MSADIIIPVYNAFEYTVKCIESVTAYAPQSHVIIINDCSTDKRVKPFLDALDKNRFTVVHNEKNFGFVGSVNIGMKLTKNDVILLNSDTEVTPRFSEKLTACACSNEKIATVTPFTNSGTICSVPEFLKDNPLPEGMTLIEVSDLVERVSVREYPEIPTGVGFCFYIKRPILDKIGLFDEQAFQTGYGEENDFCYRAIRAGYKNVLCDDTFIYHKGTASFTGEIKSKNAGENAKILDRRYPKERVETFDFIKKNPIAPLIDNVKLHMLFQNGRKNILFALHMPVPYKTGDSTAGGTQKHVLELESSLRGTYNTAILWPEAGRGLCLLAPYHNEFIELFFAFKNPDNPQAETESILKNILKSLRFDLVHIHHTMNMKGVCEAAKSLDIPVVFTAHDFYLLREDFDKAKIPAQGVDENRLREAGAFLKNCSLAVAPDSSVAETFQKLLPEADIKTVEHGVELSHYDLSCHDDDKAESAVLRVAYVGVLSALKGGFILKDAVLSSDPEKVEWHIFGTVDDVPEKSFENRAVFHGAYKSRDIVKFLKENHIDLVCFLPQVPETYSYTLTECFIAGMPALGLDIGAVGSRIKSTGFGFVLPADATGREVSQKVKEISENRKQLNEIKAKLKNYQPVTLTQMAERYKGLYESLFINKKADLGEADHKMIVGALRDASKAGTLGAAMAGDVEGARGKLKKLLPRPLADFLLYGRYPFKRQLKKAAAVCYRKIKKSGD